MRHGGIVAKPEQIRQQLQHQKQGGFNQEQNERLDQLHSIESHSARQQNPQGGQVLGQPQQVALQRPVQGCTLWRQQRQLVHAPPRQGQSPHRVLRLNRHSVWILLPVLQTAVFGQTKMGYHQEQKS